MNRHADNLTMFQKIRVELCVTGFPRRLTEKTAFRSRVIVLLTVPWFVFFNPSGKKKIDEKIIESRIETNLCLSQHYFGYCL